MHHYEHRSLAAKIMAHNQLKRSNVKTSASNSNPYARNEAASCRSNSRTHSKNVSSSTKRMKSKVTEPRHAVKHIHKETLVQDESADAVHDASVATLTGK